MDPIIKQLGILAAIGAVIGIGKDLTKEETPSRRAADKKTVGKFVGRLILNMALAVTAGSVFLLFPNLPFLGVCGIAAAIVIIGEAYFLKKLDKYLDKKIRDN